MGSQSISLPDIATAVLKLLLPLWQQTSLHIAAREGYEYTVESLVKQGAVVDIKDKNGVSIWDYTMFLSTWKKPCINRKLYRKGYLYFICRYHKYKFSQLVYSITFICTQQVSNLFHLKEKINLLALGSEVSSSTK